MSSVVLQGCRITNAQVSHFQVVRSPDMGSADMKGLHFADAKESLFQDCKRSYMNSAVLQDVLMFRNCVFKMTSIC
jgi:hypothetical protein